MNKLVIGLVLLVNLLSFSVVQAAQEVDQFGICLTDSMNGKERKELAKWIFFGISSHSTIKPYANVSEQDIDDSNRYIGELIPRLVAEDCPSQAKAASKVMGSAAFEQAFRIVGEVAMQELMTEPSVGQTLGGFEQYLDQEKFDDVFD